MSEPFEPEYGNHVGLVVAVNDDGRVKVWVPHLTNTVYTELNENLKDLSFKSFENNLNAELKQKLLETLPWAEAAVPTFGGGTSGYVNTSSGIASINPPLPNIKPDDRSATQKKLPFDETKDGYKPVFTNTGGGVLNIPGVNSDFSKYDPNASYFGTRKNPNIDALVIHHLNDEGKNPTGNNAINAAYNDVKSTGVGYIAAVREDGQVSWFGDPTKNVTGQIKSGLVESNGFTNSNTMGIVIAGDSGSYTQAQTDSIAAIAKYYNIQNVAGHGELSSNREDIEGTAIANNIRATLGLAKNWIDPNESIRSKNLYANAKDTSGGNDSAKSLNLTPDGKPNVSDSFLRTKSDADNSINKYLQETGLAYKQLSPSDLEQWNAYANQYNKNLIFDQNDTQGSWNRIAQAWVNQESGYKNSADDSNKAVTAGSVNQALGLTQSSVGQAANLNLAPNDSSTAARLVNDADFNIKVGINLLNNQFDKGGIFDDNGLKKVSGSFSPSYDGGETRFLGQNLLANMMTKATKMPDGNKDLGSDNNLGGTFAQTGSSGNTDPNPVRTHYQDAMAENCIQNTGAGSSNGMYSRPVVGSKVWVFFHGGDIQRPVYFASTLERHGVIVNYQQQPRTPIEYSSQDPTLATRTVYN